MKQVFRRIMASLPRRLQARTRDPRAGSYTGIRRFDVACSGTSLESCSRSLSGTPTMFDAIRSHPYSSA